LQLFIDTSKEYAKIRTVNLGTGGVMVNPFQFGRVVQNEQFCNRKKELADIKSAIRSGNSLWLYSPRRFGKTSLVIKSFSQIDDVKTIYFDLYNIRDKADFAQKYLDVLTKELFSLKMGATSALKKISSLIKNLTPTISLDHTGSPTIGVDIKPGEEEKTIESILQLPQKLNLKKKICIAFDEFQEIERIDPFLKNTMRSIFQHQDRVSYIFLGSKESIMHTIFSDSKSPFYQFGQKMTIREISKADLTEYISKMFNETSLNIEAKTIEHILGISKGHPHYTQYGAYVAWELINQGIEQNVNFRSTWLNHIIDNQADALRTIYEQLNANQRKVLFALSDMEDSSLLTNEIMRKYKLPAKSTTNTTLTSLVTKSILLKQDKKYHFDNPIFREWIRRLYA